MTDFDLIRRTLKGFLVTCFLILAGAWAAYATHLRAGNILVQRNGPCSQRTYTITIIVYTNTNNTNVLFGGDQDWLDFGDNSPRVLVPEIGPGHPNYTIIDSQRGIAAAYYTVTHTYPGPRQYTISYVEPNRNEGVLNMDNSVNTTFYLETMITIDPYFGCSSPAFLAAPPIDRACAGVSWTHNPGASDEDSISYEMVVPNRDRQATVLNYKDPNDPKFYTNHGQGNEAGTGPPTFFIDQQGTVTWDAPGAVGEYNIAFVVKEWRKVDGQFYLTGFVRRDMQILVEDCDNKRPDLEVPEDICVDAGTIIDETIFATDPDNDEVRIEAFSEILRFNQPSLRATISPDPPAFQSSVPSAELDFRWETKCEHIREQPYQVVFKVTDRRGGGLGLATYKTWRIRVVGPAPTWKNASLNLTNRYATVEWDPYTCANAEFMQVWRKVDSTSFQPDSCQTGMPESLGYTLLDNSVPVGAGTYVDNNGGRGLSPGAMYCYRLVAVYPLPGGGESYVSRDTCVGPILADVPIITHVTVESTDVTTGEIRVSWKRPFDINETRPYRYEVWRGVGAARTDSVLITTLTGDTTFLDGGLNTEESIYNYSIRAFSATNTLIGSSFPASSVRLETRSEIGTIELNWSAIVPWSNQIRDYPEHLVFRGPEGATEDELVLLASVDVLTDGQRFVDRGNLQDGQTYCYRVMTRGGYGNPNKIPEPLENYSQMICVQPGDSIPPCKPTLTVDREDCATIFSRGDYCSQGTYKNRLTFATSDLPGCGSDIASYRIYHAAYRGAEFTFHKSVPATVNVFEDINLLSLAWCYRVTAVDRSGNESEPSDIACNDNCPYYELPNVFSPNDDSYNDVFSAFNIRDYLCETCGEAPAYLKEKCARFVEKVKFKVFNRWGQQVYEYESEPSNENKSIYVDWDGKDENGVELATAVYYYVAEVTFTVLDPDERVKIFKGWVHLLDDQQ